MAKSVEKEVDVVVEVHKIIDFQSLDAQTRWSWHIVKVDLYVVEEFVCTNILWKIF